MFVYAMGFRSTRRPVGLSAQASDLFELCLSIGQVDRVGEHAFTSCEIPLLETRSNNTLAKIQETCIFIF
jgi:hypothetical protein